MTDIQKALADFLNLLVEGVKAGANFASQQIPLVLQEKLRYEVVSSLAWIGIWLVLIIAAWIVQQVLWRYAVRHETETDADFTTFLYIMPTAVAVVVSVVGLIDIIYNINHALYIWVAPRVFILDWLTDLLKQAK